MHLESARPIIERLAADVDDVVVECVDRIFLNGYEAKLQEPTGSPGSLASIAVRRSPATSCSAR